MSETAHTPRADEPRTLERAAEWPVDSPLHSVADDVAGLVEAANREYARGMSGEANWLRRCASRIARAALAPQGDDARERERLAEYLAQALEDATEHGIDVRVWMTPRNLRLLIALLSSPSLPLEEGERTGEVSDA